MDLIVSHRDADFDALSSLIAAKKLYPGARVVLSGSREKSVRNFIGLFRDRFDFEDERTCSFEGVRKLIIVDNRHPSRIGRAQDILSEKGLVIHIYDHHPRTRFDIKADKDVFKEVGATVTILLEILLKKGKLDLNALEATLMLLGIYEETGSLSYRTTTKLDVDMVSVLLELGANLSAVSSYINRELDADELRALSELLKSVEIEEVSGVKIVFAKADISDFTGETGTVVHKFQDVENYPVLFAFFTIGPIVKVLARSRTDAVDVNKLLSHFGGAGHSSAASVRFEGKSCGEIKALLLVELKKMIKPGPTAADIMVPPVRLVNEDEIVSAVMKGLEDASLKGAPVVDAGSKLVGVITSENLKKAVARGMGHSRVKGYMTRNFHAASPDTPLYIIRSAMTDREGGVIPVVFRDSLVGVITRADMVKRFYDDEQSSSLGGRMRKDLPKKLVGVISKIGDEAAHAGMSAFLVGGFVRDLLLGVRNYDLDIVVEGNALFFAERLRKRFGGTLVTHKRFGTATLVKDWPKWLGPFERSDKKFKIDIATARKEKYERPAALPVVEFSSLRDDFYRRDFTINAMAVGITGGSFGSLVDFFGGLRDLKKGVIRVLHDKSFIDDPTRIFRAVRFEQRFDFRIEKHTEYLIRHAVKQRMFHRTENQRIREELILMFMEEKCDRAILRMRNLHELRFIHPRLVLRRDFSVLFGKARKCAKWYYSRVPRARQLDEWLINFFIMLDGLTKRQTEEVIRKFVFTRSAGLRLRSLKEAEEKFVRTLSSRKKVPPSRVYRLLEPLSHEVTLYLLAKTRHTAVRKRIKKFFLSYNGMELSVRGEDIRRLGIPPGPLYKEILRRVLCEKLDGKLPTRAAELRYMKDVARDVS